MTTAEHFFNLCCLTLCQHSEHGKYFIAFYYIFAACLYYQNAKHALIQQQTFHQMRICFSYLLLHRQAHISEGVQQADRRRDKIFLVAVCLSYVFNNHYTFFLISLRRQFSKRKTFGIFLVCICKLFLCLQLIHSSTEMYQISLTNKEKIKLIREDSLQLLLQYFIASWPSPMARIDIRCFQAGRRVCSTTSTLEIAMT